ncbi:hypothetical protein L9G15_25415, partial [Shewanella sp. A3A]|nr:hypothetical protein [Shewanella ferrihydritica]
LSPDFFWERGVHVRDTVHLDMEMNWFRDLLGLLCPDDLAAHLLFVKTKPSAESRICINTL